MSEEWWRVEERGPPQAVVIAFDPPQRRVKAQEDAARWIAALKDAGWKVDDTLVGDQATPQNASALLRELRSSERTRRAGALLVVVIGHGEQLTTEYGDYQPAVVMAPWREGQAYDHLFLRDLLTEVEELPNARKAIVANVCFWGLPEEEAGLSAGPRRGTHLLTAAGLRGRDLFLDSNEDISGLYTTCMLESLRRVNGLLAAHHQAVRCLPRKCSDPGLVKPDHRATCEEQIPQLYPGDLAVEIPIDGPLAGDPPLLLDGLSPRLEGSPLWVDGRPLADSELRGGVLALSGGEHTFSLSDPAQADRLVVRREAAGGYPLLLLSPPAGEVTHSDRWLRIAAASRAQRPRFEEIGEAALSSVLTASDRPAGVVAVDLDGAGRPGLFITRRGKPPIYLVNTALEGDEPRYEDRSSRFGLDQALPYESVGRPWVMDIDQDGHPDVCFDRIGAVSCFNRAGAVDLRASLAAGALLRAPLVQGDLDNDGDLDLIAQRGDELLSWSWDGSRYGDEVLISPRPDQPADPLLTSEGAWLLPIDGDGLPDLLAFSDQNTPLIWLNNLLNGGWKRIQAEDLGLRSSYPLLAASLAGRGEWDLVSPDTSALFPGMPEGGAIVYSLGLQGRLIEGPLPGPEAPGDGQVLGILAGDLNMDGWPDLLILHRQEQPNQSRGPHSVFYYQPDPGQWLPAQPLGEPADDQGAVIEDLDMDGTPDVFALNGGERGQRSRLYLNRQTASSVLRVDFPPPAGQRAAPLAGAELLLQVGGRLSRSRLDGSQRIGAEWFPLGPEGHPDWLEVYFTDRKKVLVRRECAPQTEERNCFRRAPWGYQVVVEPGDQGSSLAMVGPYLIRPDDLTAPPALAEGLRPTDIVEWILPLGEGRFAAWAKELGGTRARLHWLDRAGQAWAAPSEAPGCEWASWLPVRARLLLACEPAEEAQNIQLLAPGAASGTRWELRPQEGVPWRWIRAQGSEGGAELTLRGFPRQAVEWCKGPPREATAGEGRCRVLITHGRRRLTAWDLRSSAPLDEAAASLPGGASDREYIQLAPDGRLLTRIDDYDGHSWIELLDPRSLAAPAERIAIGPAAGHRPAWDSARGWWWTPVRGGVEAIIVGDPPQILRLSSRAQAVLSLLPTPQGLLLVEQDGDASRIRLIEPYLQRELAVGTLPSFRGRGAALLQ